MGPNYCAKGDTDIEKDESVPEEKKAIKIAEMHQKLAVEELEYLKQLQEIQRTLSLAANAWNLAREKHEADKCMAEATQVKAKRTAYFEWLTALGEALEQKK